LSIVFAIVPQGVRKRRMEERQERLHRAISESDRLPISKVIDGHGKALFELTVQHGLEALSQNAREVFTAQGREQKTGSSSKI